MIFLNASCIPTNQMMTTIQNNYTLTKEWRNLWW